MNGIESIEDGMTLIQAVLLPVIKEFYSIDLSSNLSIIYDLGKALFEKKLLMLNFIDSGPLASIWMFPRFFGESSMFVVQEYCEVALLNPLGKKVNLVIMSEIHSKLSDYLCK
jgi:hypothetical protein